MNESALSRESCTCIMNVRFIDLPLKLLLLQLIFNPPVAFRNSKIHIKALRGKGDFKIILFTCKLILHVSNFLCKKGGGRRYTCALRSNTHFHCIVEKIERKIVVGSHFYFII